MSRVAASAVLVALSFATPAMAQSPALDECRDELAKEVSTSKSEPTTPHDEAWTRRIKMVDCLRKKAALNLSEDIARMVDVNLNPEAFLLFAYEQNLTRNLQAVEGARTDKQLGAPAAADGSTSLVSKGSVPAILAFAVEHGAATQTVNGTAATIRGNAIGWVDLLQGQDLISAYNDDSAIVRALRRLSYSFTFDVTPAKEAKTEERPDVEAVQEQVDQQRQLTAYSVHVSLIDQRDPRRRDNQESAQTSLRGASMDVLQKTVVFQPVFESSDYRRWLADTTSALIGASGGASEQDLKVILYRRLENLRQLMIGQIADFETVVDRFVVALRTFDAGRLAWFEQLQKRFVLAAELVRNRPPSEAGTSTFRVVGEGRVGKTNLDLTLNFAFTRQDSGTALVPEPKETGGWRDIQLGVQAELPIGRRPSCVDAAAGVGRPALAFEYLSRKLFDDAVVTFAGHDFSVEPGWIHAAQAKLTFPMKGSGVKIPISVSIANRTELIKEQTVRGHIGLTFDLDVLAAAVRR